MVYLIAGLIIFLGIHSVRILAPAYRDRMVTGLGDNGWRALYSAISIIGFAVLIWGYGIARAQADIVYVPPSWGRHFAGLLMIFAFIALMAYALPGGRIKALLKHPMLVSIKIWALSHLLANGDAASVVLFGSFLVWAIVDRVSMKRRGAPDPVSGPLRNDAIAVAVGVGLWALFAFGAHAWLFGVAPFV